MNEEHEHIFTKKVRNDMNTKFLYLCEICGCQDGTKFWAELNNEWNFRYDIIRWFKNKFKKII